MRYVNRGSRWSTYAEAKWNYAFWFSTRQIRRHDTFPKYHPTIRVLETTFEIKGQNDPIYSGVLRGGQPTGSRTKVSSFPIWHIPAKRM